MSSKLHNYVRTYRRRSSLGQQDVAFLLGHKGRENVCRYEQGHRIPSLRTALAIAAVLDVSVAALFGGTQKEVQRHIAERTAVLRSELRRKYGTGRASPAVSRRLRWLDDHHGRVQIDGHQSP